MLRISNGIKNESRAACAMFLFALAMGLFRAGPWFGWGGQPDFAASAFSLMSGPSSASALNLLLVKISGSLIPAGGTFAFASNVFAAFLFALASAAVFFAGSRIAASLPHGVLAWLVFVMLRWAAPVFAFAGQGAFSVFYTAALVMLAVFAWRAAEGVSPAAPALALALCCGLFAGQHLFFILAAPAFIYFSLKRDKALLGNYGRIAAGAFLLVLGLLAPLALIMLRPRFGFSVGEGWAQSFSAALNIPDIESFGKAFRTPEQSGMFFGEIFNALMENAWAPYFPAFAFSVIGIALMQNKRAHIAPPMALFAFISTIAYMMSPASGMDSFVCIFLIFAAVTFAAGAGEFGAYFSSAEAPSLRKWGALFMALAVVSALWPVFRGGLKYLAPERHSQRPYVSEVLLGAERDALFMISGEDDPLYSILAARDLDSIRKDTGAIYLKKLADAPYRAMLRNSISSHVDIPGEKDFALLRRSTAEFSKAPYGENPSEAVMTTRVKYNLMMMTAQATALNNSAVVPVYVETIQRFVRNTAFNKMVFEPKGAAFKVRANRVGACIHDGIFDTYAAAKRVDLLPRSGDPVDRTAVVLAEIVATCDARRDGFSSACVRLSLRALTSKNSISRNRGKDDEYRNFFPLPEISEACFRSEYKLAPAGIVSGWKRHRDAGLTRDPVSSTLISSYYTDLGEYAYIHNIDVDMGWLFQTAVVSDDNNPRAHLMLLFLYENSAKHGKAQREADKLIAILSSKERSGGGLDEFYYYMLQDLYQRIGRPDEAEKYRNLIQGKSERSLIP